jgi:DNA-binding GntR family transcriptional regulator
MKEKIPTSSQSLVDTATQLLRNRILDLTLEPGVRLDDRLLMDTFNLSRTPAREAMNRLSTEGLILFRSNRGAYVAPLDLGHITDLMDAYIINERAVVFLLRFDDSALVTDLRNIQKQYARVQKKRQLLDITHHNARFHSRIAEATANRFVWEYAVRLYNLARRVSFYIYLKERDRMASFRTHAKMIDQHHEHIIELIDAKNKKKLMKLITEHALLFRDRINRVLVDAQGESFDPDWQLSIRMRG